MASRCGLYVASCELLTVITRAQSSPNLAAGVIPDGPDQLWVADLSYVAIAVGFVYVAVILDAWSRRVVGYAISRRIDTRLTLAALRAAVETRRRRYQDVSTTRIAAVSTPLICIAKRWLSLGYVVRWADVAILTTTPKPRAS